MRRRLLLVPILLSLLATGCSARLLSDAGSATLTNVCTAPSDCGEDAECSNGACVAKSGAISEVLLEVIPEQTKLSETASPGQGGSSTSLGFLAVQKLSETLTSIELPGAETVTGRVISGAEHAKGCSSLISASNANVDLSAFVEFTRTGILGGTPIVGIASNGVRVGTGSGFSFPATLVPGIYDVYVEPACPLAPMLLKGLEIRPQLSPTEPPRTIALLPPFTLTGKVQRRGATLMDWQVSLIEPEGGRRISTVQKLGDTTGESSDGATNFSIDYQPVQHTEAAAQSSARMPLLRIAPPENLVAPTVTWDLAAVDIGGIGKVSLDMTGVPTPEKLVRVLGRVRFEGRACRARLFFFTAKLAGSAGLTATFSRKAETDANGRYAIDLFPGDYRFVTVPLGEEAEAPPPGDAGAATTAAINEHAWTVGQEGAQTHDIDLSARREIRGHATVETTGEAATSAVFEAVPSLLPNRTNALRDALAQTQLLPPNTTTLVEDASGHFEVKLDPGTYDLSLRPPEGSKFAWWVRPAVTVGSMADDPLKVEPTLPPPVLLQGRVTDAQKRPVRAIVRAYAKTPSGGGVTLVGSARSREDGTFDLPLPSRFGS